MGTVGMLPVPEARNTSNSHQVVVMLSRKMAMLSFATTDGGSACLWRFQWATETWVHLKYAQNLLKDLLGTDRFRAYTGLGEHRLLT